MPRCLVLAVLVFAWRAPAVVAQSTYDFFDDSILHEIRLEVPPSDWQELKDFPLLDTFYRANLRWLYQGKYVEIADVGIRQDTLAGRNSAKPGLFVDFTHFAAGRMFLELSSIVLRNNSQDASQMHDRVAMALMRQLGLPSLHQAHARVFVNGDYTGLYSVVESVDRTYLKRNFGEDTGQLHGFGTNPVDEVLVPLLKVLNEKSDLATAKALSPIVDVQLLLKQLAAESFLAESDGLLGELETNGYYVYKSASGRLTFIPSDKSGAFTDINRSILRNLAVNEITKGILSRPQYRSDWADYVARAAVAAGSCGGWLEHQVERVDGQIREAAYEDPYISRNDYDRAVENMYSFAQDRADRVFREVGKTLLTDR
jgi:spore coat protein CotH